MYIYDCKYKYKHNVMWNETHLVQVVVSWMVERQKFRYKYKKYYFSTTESGGVIKVKRISGNDNNNQVEWNIVHTYEGAEPNGDGGREAY